jgi:hypothetical protein
LAAAEQITEWGSRKRVLVLHLDPLAGGNVHHCRLQLLGQVGKAGRRARTGHDGLHLRGFILRNLGTSRKACNQRQRTAGEEQRRSHSVSISHVAKSSLQIDGGGITAAACPVAGFTPKRLNGV